MNKRELQEALPAGGNGEKVLAVCDNLMSTDITGGYESPADNVGWTVSRKRIVCDHYPRGDHTEPTGC